MRFTQVANLVGLPAISLPLTTMPSSGGDPPLPCGLQLMGPAWADARVLRVACVLEGELAAEGLAAGAPPLCLNPLAGAAAPAAGAPGKAAGGA